MVLFSVTSPLPLIREFASVSRQLAWLFRGETVFIHILHTNKC